MSFFNRYIFPALYGLLNYFTIRLLHDVEAMNAFWKRPLPLNSLEIGLAIIVGYIGVWLFRRLIIHFDKNGPVTLSSITITKELLMLLGVNIALLNLFFTPMAALTDDGLSWADFTDINVIPSLYAVMFYGIARSRGFLKAYIDQQLKMEKMSNDHLQTELKFLKAQYHPHFLFNALNTIYFQMDEDIAGAKHSIEQFSELLRYQLYDQRQQVPIRQELDYLQSFIELQKLRCSNRLQLSLEIDERLSTQLIYPLLLLPLVENAFKYIGGNYLMLITIKLVDDQIVFKAGNSTPALKTESKSSGIGLENLKRRLQLLYPNRHRFTITKTPDYFTAQLCLNNEH